MSPKLEDLTYRELQKLCKSKGLKASGKTEELIQRIKDYYKNRTPEDTEEPEEKEEEPQEDVMDLKDEYKIVTRDTGNTIRFYTKEIHGEKRKDLAEQYVSHHENAKIE